MSYANASEPIEMPFGKLTIAGYRNDRIRRGSRSDESILSRVGDKSAMRPFDKLYWILVSG